MNDEKQKLSKAFPKAEISALARKKASIIAAQLETENVGEIIEAGINALFDALPEDALESTSLEELSSRMVRMCSENSSPPAI